MVMDLKGQEIGPGMVVRFWCVPEGTFVRGYITEIAPGGERATVKALEPGAVKDQEFVVWSADCEIVKDSRGRPVHFQNGREVEDDAEEGPQA